jgi:hypothetical protein
MTAARLDRLASAIRAAWSCDTAKQWTPDNPAAGQCNVTSIVLQELAGGEILKTRIGEDWHFDNRVGADRLDLTAGQFTEPVAYDDVPTTAQEAFDGVTVNEYQAMKQAVMRSLG